MQFIYIDESGLGNEPIAVMVGIIADSHRMRITKNHWSGLLEYLSGEISTPIQEIHTRDFYSGNSPWRDLDGNKRSAVIEAIFQWLVERKHSLIITAVDKTEFLENFKKEEFAGDIKSLWQFMALHLALSIQKCYQGSIRNNNRTVNPKGHSLLIFDKEVTEQEHFTDLLLNAPDWTDTYYDRKPRQEKFSQIIDVPHFVDSKDVGLIQLADFVCFFLRKYIELSMGYTKPKYRDEIKFVNHWAETILNCSISKSNTFLSRSRCDCSDLFFRYAPRIIR